MIGIRSGKRVFCVNKISNIHFDPYKLITTRYYDYYEIEISNFKFITTIVAGGLTVFEKRKKKEKMFGRRAREERTV